MKLAKENNDRSRDGRLSVLLCLITCLLFYKLSIEYNWFSFLGEDSPKGKENLQVTESGLVVVDKPFMDTGTEKTKSIPVEYTPLFFQPIPINIATKEMLMTVKGIGPSLAENILDHRRKSGPFKNIEDLLGLKGIGRKRALQFENSFDFNRLH